MQKDYVKKEINRTTKERHKSALGYAEAMLSYYNKKFKIPLKRNNLYSSENHKSRIDIGSTDDETDIIE